MEGAEVTAGAGLVGADLGTGGGGAVETGGAEPGVDMHRGTGGTHFLGELEGASGTVVTHRAAIERHRGKVGQIDGHEELVVGDGIPVVQPRVGTDDMQRVAFDLRSYACGDIPRTIGQQKALGTELPQGGLFVPAQGAIVPVGFDEGVAGTQGLCDFGDTGEAEVDGLGQQGRETVGKCQLGTVFLLSRCARVGRTVGVLLDLLAIEHHIYLVTTSAVLHPIGINL